MSNNIELNMGIDEYHSRSEISSTQLKVLADKTPAHFKAYIETPNKSTPAMALGNIIHSAVLEPETFDSIYVVEPKFDKRTNAGKAEYAAWQAANNRKIGISKADFDTAMACAEAINNHPEANAWLSGGIAESSYFWTDKKTGEKCRVRPDYLKGNVLVDLKSCEDASPTEFMRSIAKYGYHISAGMYMDGVSQSQKIDEFIWIAVEKKPPYGIAIYIPDYVMLEIGRAKYRAALDLYHACKLVDVWPGYDQKVRPISLPGWAV